MRYASEVCHHIKIVNRGVCFRVMSALYPFNEGHFPGGGTCNQLSLSVTDLQQVVIVAGSQCVHHFVFVCKQLHRENMKTLILVINHIITSSDSFGCVSFFGIHNRLLLFCCMYAICIPLYINIIEHYNLNDPIGYPAGSKTLTILTSSGMSTSRLSLATFSRIAKAISHTFS